MSPRYKAVIEDEEHERLDVLLGTLQSKDEVQQRMEAITHLTVTAWRCATCNSTTDKRRASCQVSRCSGPHSGSALQPGWIKDRL